MSRILVTGANGFIGRLLCAKLAERHTVIGLVRRKQNTVKTSGIEFIEGDIARIDSIDAGAVDFCIHLAAVTDIPRCEHEPSAAIGVNVKGTYNVLELCRKLGVRGVVLASSTKVYGRSEGPITEDTIPNPRTVYGLTKLCAEAMTQKFSKLAGVPAIVARLSNVYGPCDSNTQRFIPHTITSILANRKPLIHDNGSAERVLVYVADAVAFFEKALDLLEGGVCGVFNVGNGKPLPIRTIVQHIATLMEWSGGLEHDDVPVSSTDRAISIERSRGIGWEPRTSLDDGLKRTIDWYRNGG